MYSVYGLRRDCLLSCWYLRFGSSSGLTHPLPPDRKYLHAAQRAGTQGHGLRGSATLPCCKAFRGRPCHPAGLAFRVGIQQAGAEMRRKPAHIYASSLISELQVRTLHGSGHTGQCWWESNLAFQRGRALIEFLLSFLQRSWLMEAHVSQGQPEKQGARY